VTIKLKEGAGCGPVSPPVWTLSSGNVPPGLTFSSNGLSGAVISGTPTQAGNFTFYITVHHPFVEGSCAGDSSDKKHTIPINQGLAKLTVGPEQTGVGPGTVGAPYALQMTASVPEAKSWTINSGALPPGLAINQSSGLISGTPTAAGTYTFEVLAKMNGDTRSDTKTLAITVRDRVAISASQPFQPNGSTVGEVAIPFDAMLAVTGGTNTYTWSIAAGTLPPGLLFADGAITGTPTTAGVYPVTFSVSDSEGRVATYTSRFAVASKLQVSTVLLRPGRVGKVYTARLKTSGGVKPTTWRAIRGKLPRGLRLDRTLGTVYGTPKRAGRRFVVTFEVTDELGGVARKTYRIVIAP
jgi:hypothetical protein